MTIQKIKQRRNPFIIEIRGLVDELNFINNADTAIAVTISIGMTKGIMFLFFL